MEDRLTRSLRSARGRDSRSQAHVVQPQQSAAATPWFEAPAPAAPTSFASEPAAASHFVRANHPSEHVSASTNLLIRHRDLIRGALAASLLLCASWIVQQKITRHDQFAADLHANSAEPALAIAPGQNSDGGLFSGTAANRIDSPATGARIATSLVQASVTQQPTQRSTPANANAAPPVPTASAIQIAVPQPAAPAEGVIISPTSARAANAATPNAPSGQAAVGVATAEGPAIVAQQNSTPTPTDASTAQPPEATHPNGVYGLFDAHTDAAAQQHASQQADSQQPAPATTSSSANGSSNPRVVSWKRPAWNSRPLPPPAPPADALPSSGSPDSADTEGPTIVPARPAPSTQPAPPTRFASAEAEPSQNPEGLVQQARVDLEEGRTAEARQKLVAAKNADGVYGLFADRPEAMLSDIDKVNAQQIAARHGNSKPMSFHFNNAPWPKVLNLYAKYVGLDLKMESVPRGTFTYKDAMEYTPAQVLGILNSFLVPRGCQLRVVGNALCVVPLDRPDKPVVQQVNGTWSTAGRR